MRTNKLACKVEHLHVYPIGTRVYLNNVDCNLYFEKSHQGWLWMGEGKPFETILVEQMDGFMSLPKSFYYCYHGESDAIWKQVQPFDKTSQSDSEDVYDLSYEEYFDKLLQLNYVDGEHMIQEL
jgi:hypothetical protein